MKKAVIALLALCISLVAAVALVGCGESGPADKKADFIWFKVEVPEGVSVSNSAGDKTWLTGDYKHSGGTTSVFIIGVNEGSVSITVDNFEDHKAEVETVLNTIEFADNMSEAMKEAKEVKLTDIDLKR